ncbi:MAG: hypothetical protein WD871_15310 [Xanthobacteraceae bacterium]
MITLRGEIAFLLTITVGPALLLVADATAYDRSVPVLAVPAAAAVLLLLLGAISLVNTRAADAAPTRTDAIAGSFWELVYLAAVVLGLFLLGPRIGLPAFGLVFARAMGANWFAALATAAACAALVEFMLVRALSQPLPFLPILSSLGG